MEQNINQGLDLIPLNDFLSILGYKSRESYRQILIKDPTAPKLIKPMGRKVFLSKQEVNAWIESKKALRG